jgi:hypothetical protein
VFFSSVAASGVRVRVGFGIGLWPVRWLRPIRVKVMVRVMACKIAASSSVTSLTMGCMRMRRLLEAALKAQASASEGSSVMVYCRDQRHKDNLQDRDIVVNVAEP